jgi:hypothetical protein
VVGQTRSDIKMDWQKCGFIAVAIFAFVALIVIPVVTTDFSRHDTESKQQEVLPPLSTKVTDSHGNTCDVFIIEKDGYKLAVAVGYNKCAMVQLVDQPKGEK